MALWSCAARGPSAPTRPSDLPAILAEIEELLVATGAPATSRRASVEPWFQYHPEFSPVPFTIRRHGELGAAAVLARRSHAGLATFTLPVTQGESSWLPTIDSPSAHELGEAILGHLAAARRPWRLEFTGLPAGDPVVEVVRAGVATSVVDQALQAPELWFDQPRPLIDHLSSNTRKALAKARNRMSKAGLKCKLDWFADAASIEALLPEVIQVHQDRNKQLRGHSLLEDPRELGLFAATVSTHARQGQARLLTLRLDGSLAAFAVCLCTGGTLFVYANLVSPDWLHFSAGAVANAEVVRAAHADPTITRIDWGAGIQRYKVAGGATVRPLMTLEAWSPGVLKPALQVLDTGKRRFRGLVRCAT